jgi:hypothetical protein
MMVPLSAATCEAVPMRDTVVEDQAGYVCTLPEARNVRGRNGYPI